MFCGLQKKKMFLTSKSSESYLSPWQRLHISSRGLLKPRMRWQRWVWQMRKQSLGKEAGPGIFLLFAVWLAVPGWTTQWTSVSLLWHFLGHRLTQGLVQHLTIRHEGPFYDFLCFSSDPNSPILEFWIQISLLSSHFPYWGLRLWKDDSVCLLCGLKVQITESQCRPTSALPFFIIILWSLLTHSFKKKCRFLVLSPREIHSVSH